MPNQTQHTPLSPSPLGRGLGGGLSQKMKPITIPPEMQDLVKKINKLATTVIPELEKSEEEQNKQIQKEQKESLYKGYTQEDKELIQELQNKYPEWYKENGNKLSFGEDFIGIEIDGKILKFDREDLKTEKLDRNYLIVMKDTFYEDGIINSDGHTYFTFNIAQREANKLGKRLPTKEEWEKIGEFMPGDKNNEKTSNLIKILNLSIAGYFTGITGVKLTKSNELSTYWSSSAQYDKKEMIGGFNIIIGNTYAVNTNFLNSCLLVRCIEEIEKPDFKF